MVVAGGRLGKAFVVVVVASLVCAELQWIAVEQRKKPQKNAQAARACSIWQTHARTASAR